MSTVKTIEKIDAREIRRKLGMNQQQFWSTLGVTQSGGSRYESGRNMPKPVRELLRLVTSNKSTSRASSAKTGKLLSI